MAAGLPDYQRTVRPMYGAAKILRADTIAVPKDTVFVGSIEGKGMIYGGCLYPEAAIEQKDSAFLIKIDGSDVGQRSFSDMEIWWLVSESSYITYLLQYDQKRHRYSVGLCPGVTFETSFEIYYIEDHNEAPIVVAKVNYALI